MALRPCKKAAGKFFPESVDFSETRLRRSRAPRPRSRQPRIRMLPPAVNLPSRYRGGVLRHAPFFFLHRGMNAADTRARARDHGSRSADFVCKSPDIVSRSLDFVSGRWTSSPRTGLCFAVSGLCLVARDHGL